MERITIEDNPLVVVNWEGPGWYRRRMVKDPSGTFHRWIKVGFVEGRVRVSRPEQLRGE